MSSILPVCKILPKGHAMFCSFIKLKGQTLDRRILCVLQLLWFNSHKGHIKLSGALFKSKRTLFLPFFLLIVFQLQDLKVLEALLLTLSTQILEIQQTTLHLLKVSLQMSCAKAWKSNKVYVKENNMYSIKNAKAPMNVSILSNWKHITLLLANEFYSFDLGCKVWWHFAISTKKSTFRLYSQ